MTAVYRYNNDLAFRTLVDSLRQNIDDGILTPADILQAVDLIQAGAFAPPNICGFKVKITVDNTLPPDRWYLKPLPEP